jgi:hypothetical protein
LRRRSEGFDGYACNILTGKYLLFQGEISLWVTASSSLNAIKKTQALIDDELD